MKRRVSWLSRAFESLGCSALLTSSSFAFAQTQNAIAAEELFNAGRARMEKNDWPGACAKFAASQELDPAASTAVKLAKCRDHEGKLTEAWYELEKALKLNRERVDQSESRRAELDAFIQQQIASIQPRIPHLRIVVRDAPAGVTIKRDGTAQPIATLKEALPIDPGTHAISAEAPGYTTARRNVTLAEGQTLEATFDLVPNISEAPVPLPDVPGQAPPEAPPKGPPPKAPPKAAPPKLTPLTSTSQPPPSHLSNSARGTESEGQRTLGYFVGAGGLVGLGAGAVLGIVTLVEVNGRAPGTAGNPALANARATQAAGLVLAGLGTAALATGIVLVVTTPKSPHVALGVGAGSLSIRGTW